MPLKKVEAEVSSEVYRKIFWRKEQDGFGDRPWADWFTYLAKDVNNLQTREDIISETTRKGLLDMWLTNFAENLLYLRQGEQATINEPEKTEVHLISELGNPEPVADAQGAICTEHSAIVVGAGPSIIENKHLELLAERKKEYAGYIVATDRMLIPLLEYGIIPYITVTVDGSGILNKFYDHELVRKNAAELKIILPTSVNHKVAKTVIDNGAHIYWFNPMFDEWSKEDSFTRILYVMSKIESMNGPPLIQCGGNAGSTSWVFAWEMLKASPVCLIGFDMGYPIDTKLEETPYFSGVLELGKQGPGLTNRAITNMYDKIWHPYFKKWAKYDFVFKHYRAGLLGLIKTSKPWVHTINATEGGTLFGPRVDCMKFSDFLNEHHY